MDGEHSQVLLFEIPAKNSFFHFTDIPDDEFHVSSVGTYQAFPRAVSVLKDQCPLPTRRFPEP
jgi:hypothetical protein